uniref:G-protein coupled receptors family 1 profile domain-containing protein n=1 Tax=Romanomermis culicivorax TaxID=13658 RepID=A0A915JM64_ROMCU
MLISNIASDNISFFLLNKNNNLSIVEETIINDEVFTHQLVETTIAPSNQTLYEETAIINTLKKINSICFAIIILTGLCGNGFSIFVIARSHLRKISSNHYLIALATSDSLFLMGLCMMWLSRFELPTYHEKGVCSVVIFLLNCSSWMSSWYTTALTVERCFVVYKPLSKNKVCTVSRTRRTIVCLIPWPLLFNLWVFFGTGVTEQGCNVLPHFFQIGFYLNALDTLLTFVIPILSIVICNTLICVKLCRPGGDIFSRSEHRLIGEMRKHGGGTGQHTPLVAQTPLKQSLARGTAPDIAKLINNDDATATGAQCNGGGGGPKISCGAASSGMPAHAVSAGTSASNQERNITITLLTISFVFVFMNLPSYAMRLRLFFLVLASKENNHHVSILIRVLEFLFLLLYYTNFSCNFIVYCLSSKNFRQTVQKMWRGKLHTLSSFSFSSSFPFRYLSSLRSNRTSRKTPPPLDQDVMDNITVLSFAEPYRVRNSGLRIRITD